MTQPSRRQRAIDDCWTLLTAAMVTAFKERAARRLVTAFDAIPAAKGGVVASDVDLDVSHQTKVSARDLDDAVTLGDAGHLLDPLVRGFIRTEDARLVADLLVPRAQPFQHPGTNVADFARAVAGAIGTRPFGLAAADPMPVTLGGLGLDPGSVRVRYAWDLAGFKAFAYPVARPVLLRWTLLEPLLDWDTSGDDSVELLLRGRSVLRPPQGYPVYSWA